MRALVNLRCAQFSLAYLFSTQKFLHCRNSTAILQWAANAAAGGGNMAEIAARPGIVKLLDFLREDEDEEDESEEDD